MKKQDIYAKKDKITNAIKSGRLAIAFRLLRQFSELLMTWELTDEIGRIEQSYRYMLEYAMKGIADPSRAKVYDDIVSRMLSLTDKLERHAMTGEAPTLYYNTLRYLSMSRRDSISTMLRRYEKLTQDYWSTGMQLSPSTHAAIENRAEREKLEKSIFNALWVTFPLSNEDYESVKNVFNSPGYYSYFKQLVSSAVLLGLLEFYDPRRFMLLMDAYECDDTTVSASAVIAILVAMYTYKDQTISPNILARLKSISETSPRWHNDLKDGFLELVRARDTERITRQMTDELVPEMMKLKPEIDRRFKNVEDPAIDMSDPDMNPEWQEMLEKSGIADKMRKLFEIQLEGGDVFMSTFGHLKSFPFFSDISNWFLPFHTEQSEVVMMEGELADVARLLESSPVFCNSDKYSFVLSIQTIPASQREMIKSQMNAQINNLMEIQNADDGVGSDKRRASVMNRYVQDLYRFFKLFRRKGEFTDPFVTDLNLVTVPAFNKEFNDIDSLQAIAEFYFKHRYYDDALNIFKAIEELSFPDSSLFEKIGYCYERLNNYTSALKYYEQAELLNAQSRWTLKHIALCHRMLGNPSQALGYYKRLVETEENESAATALSIGNCYLEMGNFDKAIRHYYKAVYIDGDNHRCRRQLAWALMMKRDFDKAKAIYDDIQSHNPVADDYLNMGHLALAMCDDNNALNYYKLCIAQGGLTIEDFATKLNADASSFETMGLDSSIIPLIIDAVSYSEQS